MINNPQTRYSLEEIKNHPWISSYFNSSKIDIYENEIVSNNSDYYDDSDPDNKFNNSKKLFNDSMFLTKMSMSNKMPSLHPKTNRRVSVKPNAHPAKLSSIQDPSNALPEIKDVI